MKIKLQFRQLRTEIKLYLITYKPVTEKKLSFVWCPFSIQWFCHQKVNQLEYVLFICSHKRLLWSGPYKSNMWLGFKMKGIMQNTCWKRASSLMQWPFTTQCWLSKRDVPQVNGRWRRKDSNLNSGVLKLSLVGIKRYLNGYEDGTMLK